MLWLAAAAWFTLTFRVGSNNVLLVSFRQRVTPTHLLGRMNATMRFLMTGVLALGAAASGLIGEIWDPRASIVVGAAGLALVWIPIFLSPLRRLRDLTDSDLATDQEVRS